MKKWLLHLSNCTTRPVITVPSPSSIYPSSQHSLPASGSISHSPDSFPCHLPVLLCVCLPLLPLPSPPSPSVSSLPWFSSFSTLSISASLSAQTSSDFRSNEPPIWRQRKAPFITIFFWPHYFPIHHHVCFFPPQATSQSIRPWWRSAPLADSAAH